jgi:SAM-dependent methyltransferase
MTPTQRPNFAQWLTTMLESQAGKSMTSPHGDALPGFPDATLQENTTGLTGPDALRVASAFYEDVHGALADEGSELRPDAKVLDFGVGWGRIARLFLRDVPLANLYGIDVDPEFVQLTASLFRSSSFLACSPFPPVALPNATFDLISAYSVFSHLFEEACRRWTDEFARLVRPGGYFAFTTRHEDFLGYCEWAATQHDTSSGYLWALGALFEDVREAHRRYRAGELVHATSRGVSGGGVRTEAFYGETFIPKEYVEREMCRHFDLVRYVYDPSRYDQASFVLRRKAGPDA